MNGVPYQGTPEMTRTQQAAMMTMPMPIVGDITGLLADVQMYKNQPDSRTWGNYLLSGAGLLGLGASIPPASAVRPVLDQAEQLKRSMKAWHGSPHTFDRFSMEHIGKGEGAQAFGHGFYFAENPETARIYSADRSYVGDLWHGRGLNRDFGPESIAQDALDIRGSPDEAISHLEKTLKANSRSKNPRQVEANKEVETAINLLKNGGLTRKGNLYSVGLNVSDDDLLDWDAPFTLESDVGKRIAKAAELENINATGLRAIAGLDGWGEPSRGSAVYKWLASSLGSDENASKFLNEKAGVKGLRYLDEINKGADRKRNYVIFDDSLINIDSINGRPISSGLLSGQ